MCLASYEVAEGGPRGGDTLPPTILSEKSIYGIILLIQGHLQGQKVIFKVKDIKYEPYEIKIGRSVMSFWCNFLLNNLFLKLF